MQKPKFFLSPKLILTGLITQFQGTGRILKTINFFSNFYSFSGRISAGNFVISFVLLILLEVKILQYSCSALLHGILNLKFCFSFLGCLLLGFLYSITNHLNPCCFILPAKKSLKSTAAQVPVHKKPFSPKNLSCCNFSLLSLVTHLLLGVKVRTTPSELKLQWSGWKKMLHIVFYSYLKR